VLFPVETPGYLSVLAGRKGAAAIVGIERRVRPSDSTAVPLRRVYVRILLGISRRKVVAKPVPNKILSAGNLARCASVNRSLSCPTPESSPTGK
jgi:hypothetical protein